MTSPCRRRSRSSARLWPALCLVAPGLLAPGPGSRAAAATEYAVITSPGATTETLSSRELRQLLRLERGFWKAGAPVALLLPAPRSETRAFLLRRVYGGSEEDMKRAILEKLYRGEINLAPKVVTTDEEAVAFTASGRGVIALVPADLVPDAGVRVLAIDGQLPGSASYPLKE